MCSDPRCAAPSCENIPSVNFKTYFFPRTREDIFLFRNIRLGAAGLAYVGLMPFVGHSAPYTFLDLCAFTALVNAAMGFTIGALLFETIYLWCGSIPKIIRPEYYWSHALGLDSIAAIWAALAGFVIFLDVANTSATLAFRGVAIIAGGVIAASLMICLRIYINLRKKVIQAIENACDRGGSGIDPGPDGSGGAA